MMNTADRHPPPCPVCRRPTAACICVSHVPQPLGQHFDDDLREQQQAEDAMVRPPSHRLEPFRVQYRVDEAMHLYYNRDAAGLARLIRSWFQ